MKLLHNIRKGFVLAVMFCSIPLHAGPYIKIQKIDAASSYPRINVFLTINGISSKDVAGFNGENITLHEDGARVEGPVTTTHQVDTERYLYLVFSIDSSKSISKKFLTGIKSAAVEMVKNLGPNDKLSVFRFDDSVSVVNSFTRDAENIKRGINSIERHGSKTLLYDSIIRSIESFDSIKQLNKKIIVFTDGRDEGSGATDDDVIQAARNADIPIYFICFQTKSKLRTMARISKNTGGRLIFSRRYEAAADMYRALLLEMKNRYVSRYETRLKRDGITHRIEAHLAYNDLRDRDTGFFQIDPAGAAPAVQGLLLTPEMVCIGAGILLLAIIIIGAVIIFFLIREKRILKDSFFEKEALWEKRGMTESPAHRDEDRLMAEETDASDLRYPNVWLFQKNGPETGKKYLIQWPEFTIGSGAENSIIIPDPDISAQHIRFKKVNGIYHLFDLMSERGTFLNGRKLLRPKAVRDWDEITIGRTALIFRGSIHHG